MARYSIVGPQIRFSALLRWNHPVTALESGFGSAWPIVLDSAYFDFLTRADLPVHPAVVLRAAASTWPGRWGKIGISQKCVYRFPPNLNPSLSRLKGF